MKTIPELKKGDMVNVNGEIYQIINHHEIDFGEAKEMVIELGRLGDKNPSPIMRLIYPPDNPLSLRLESADKKTGGWKEQKLVKFGF